MCKRNIRGNNSKDMGRAGNRNDKIDKNCLCTAFKGTFFFSLFKKLGDWTQSRLKMVKMIFPLQSHYSHLKPRKLYICIIWLK